MNATIVYFVIPFLSLKTLLKCKNLFYLNLICFSLKDETSWDKVMKCLGVRTVRIDYSPLKIYSFFHPISHLYQPG